MADSLDSYCSTFFLALANPLRIKILQELVKGSLSVNEISIKTKAERTLVSHNLALLSKAELVKHNKEGRIRRYSANLELVLPVFSFMNGVVCANCSLRKTCENLKEVASMHVVGENPRDPCKNCLR